MHEYNVGDKVICTVSKSEFSDKVGGGKYFFKNKVFDDNMVATVQSVRESGSVILRDKDFPFGGGCLYDYEVAFIEPYLGEA